MNLLNVWHFTNNIFHSSRHGSICCRFHNVLTDSDNVARVWGCMENAIALMAEETKMTTTTTIENCVRIQSEVDVDILNNLKCACNG